MSENARSTVRFSCETWVVCREAAPGSVGNRRSARGREQRENTSPENTLRALTILFLITHRPARVAVVWCVQFDLVVKFHDLMQAQPHGFVHTSMVL